MRNRQTVSNQEDLSISPLREQISGVQDVDQSKYHNKQSNSGGFHGGLSIIQEQKSSSNITPIKDQSFNKVSDQSSTLRYSDISRSTKMKMSFNKTPQTNNQQKNQDHSQERLKQQQQPRNKIKEEIKLQSKAVYRDKSAPRKLNDLSTKYQIYSKPQGVPTPTHQSSQQILRSKLEYLFLYYCDYSLDKGQIFVKQTNFIKLLRDARILVEENYALITEQSVNLLLSKELDNPTLKTIDFKSFLNLLVKIAVILYEPLLREREDKSIGNLNPSTLNRQPDKNDLRAIIENLLNEHILPLLEEIEKQINDNREIDKSQITGLTQNGQCITNLSIDSLKQIVCSDDDLVIIGSLLPIFWSMYEKYLVETKRTTEPVLKKYFRLLKDFEVCPYLLNQKTCFMIYYFTTQGTLIQNSSFSQSQSLNEEGSGDGLNILQRILKSKLKPKGFRLESKEQNSQLTFDQFLSILFRISVVFYDISYEFNRQQPMRGDSSRNIYKQSNDSSIEQQIPQNPRKLLSLLSRIELTKGFSSLVAHLRQIRATSTQITLTPPKNVLIQLYLNQCRFASQNELEYYRDVVLAQETDSYQICKMLIENIPIDHGNSMQNDVSDKQTRFLNQAMEQSVNEMEAFFEQKDEELMKIFQFYCSYGNPLNTEKLKSNRFIKIFQDIGLLEDGYKNVISPTKSGQGQRSTASLKQPFQLSSQSKRNTIDSHNDNKDVLNESENNNNYDRYVNNNIQNYNNIEEKISMIELDLIFKKVAAKVDSVVDTFKSQLSLIGGHPLNISPQKGSRSPVRQVYPSSYKEVEVALDQNSINYNQFKGTLFESAKVIYKNFNPYESCIMLIRDRILPLSMHTPDSRTVQNSKFQQMLQSLEDDKVIDLLTDLHQVIHKLFEIYADHRGNMEFDSFTKFCTDFSIFPDIMNKGDVHRVFQNLAFSSQEPIKFQDTSFIRGAGSQGLNESKSMTRSQNFNNKSGLFSHKQQEGNATPKDRQVQILDQHLFIEALALCALHIDSIHFPQLNPNDDHQYNNQQTTLEKILLFIEKISASEGLNRSRTQGTGSSGKKDILFQNTVMKKFDLLTPFKKKYSWYFDKKNRDSLMNSSQFKNGRGSILQSFMIEQNIKKNGGKNLAIDLRGRVSRPQTSNSKNSGQKNHQLQQQQKEDLFSMIFDDDERVLSQQEGLRKKK